MSPKSFLPRRQASIGATSAQKGEFSSGLNRIWRIYHQEYPSPPNLRHDKDSLSVRKGSLTEAVTVWLEHMGLVESVFAQERSKVGYELTIRPFRLDKKLDLTKDICALA